MSSQKRSLDELLNHNDPGWPVVEKWIAQAIRSVDVLSPSVCGGPALVSMQVTTRSPMGAVILHTGGLLVDHGWIRILGSGHERLPRSLPEWNFACGMPESLEPPPWVLIADDVLGGFFALNGGWFGPPGHSVWYLAPDTLQWEDLGISYSQFLCWCLFGKLDKFYEVFRWPDWETEVSGIGGSQGLRIDPPLVMPGERIDKRLRVRASIRDLFAQHVGSGLTTRPN